MLVVLSSFYMFLCQFSIIKEVWILKNTFPFAFGGSINCWIGVGLVELIGDIEGISTIILSSFDGLVGETTSCWGVVSFSLSKSGNSIFY